MLYSRKWIKDILSNILEPNLSGLIVVQTCYQKRPKVAQAGKAVLFLFNLSSFIFAINKIL